ncbi:hypothetical protein ACMHYB_48190 [Sorangium sp. So ce1128]
MSAPAKRPTLHGDWRSSCSWRVHIALTYKGVSHADRQADAVPAGA